MTFSDLEVTERVIRIGVTGHRILAEQDKIDAAVEEAIRRIELAFPGQRLTVISALAEGADRIVVRHVLERRSAGLIVALPLPQNDYVTDFQSDASRAEFAALIKRADKVDVMPAATTREHAYEAAGDYVLDNSDALITIWDGQNAQDRGGTGDIVARARNRGLPIAWIHAGNRKPGTHQPTSLGDSQGLLTCENIPD